MADAVLPPPLGIVRGELAVDGVRGSALARRFGTPLYVMSARRIRENARRLGAAFVSRYPRSRLLYAVKANSNLAVLRVLRDEGAWADVSGPGEIVLARAAGFRPEEILCTPSFPSEDEVAFAARSGVGLNLDAPARIPRPRPGRRRISFRVNPGFGRGGHRGIVTGGRGTKFGITERDAVAAYRRALRLGYDRFGIHAMVGSNVLLPGHFGQVAAKLTSIAGRVARELGIGFEFLDLGGGVGVPYAPGERPVDVDRLAANAVRAFRAGCEDQRLGEPELWIEPGRYLVADAGVLLACITGIRRDGETFVGLDAGMTTLLRPALYGAHHRVLPVRDPLRRPQRRVTLCGPICENTDILGRSRPMPAVRVGDLVVVLNAGAYGFVMASNYNGRLRPAEVLVREGRSVLSRARESYGDLLRHQRRG